jgi:hypothetical protein
VWEHGIIASDGGEIIAKPGMTPDELRAARLPFREPAGLTGPGHERVDLGPVIVGGHEVFVDVIFRQGRVESLGLNLSSATAKQLFGTDKPTKEQVDFYKAWVEKEAGQPSPAKFAWGEIGASADHWTGVVSIYVKYA